MDAMSSYTKFTSKTNKTKSGHIHKHCIAEHCAGKFINGYNCAKHFEKQHQSLDKSDKYLIKCTGELCHYCA